MKKIKTLLISLAIFGLSISGAYAQIPSSILGDYSGEANIKIALLSIDETFDGITIQLKQTGSNYALVVAAMDIGEGNILPEYELDNITITPQGAGYKLSRSGPLNIVIPELVVPPIPPYFTTETTLYNVPVAITLVNAYIENNLLTMEIKAVATLMGILPVTININFEGTKEILPTGTYNTGDIAVINAVIDNNGLAWEKAPEDGSSVPADWAPDFYSGVEWTTDATNKRIVTFSPYEKDLTGTLNVSGLSNLEILNCAINNLTAINIAGLNNLKSLICYTNKLTEINVSGLNNLEAIACGTNKLTEINVSGLSKLEFLGCEENNLTTLNVSGLSNLRNLYCYDNNITTLNTSNCSALELMYCSKNNLTTLNVSELSSLAYLYCSNNNLPTLNVLGLPHLIRIDCSYNDLTTIDVTDMLLEHLDCRYNYLPNEDAVVGFTGTWVGLFKFEPQKTFNSGDITVINTIIKNNGLDWYFTEIPAMYTPNWGGVIWSSDEVNRRIVELRINDQNLYGDIDISGLSKLRHFDCSNNNLNAINVSGLNDLTSLGCYKNKLTKLDVTGLKNLLYFVCAENELSKLNLSGLSNLEELFCHSNKLSILEVKELKNLKRLHCFSNNLTSIDVTGLQLTEFLCYLNFLYDPTVVAGFPLTDWDDLYFKFWPQKSPDEIIPVEGIEDIVTDKAGTPLPIVGKSSPGIAIYNMSVNVPFMLVGKIVPEDATFRAIDWIILDDGGTGAVISGVDGDILTATANGTAKMKAFILHGITIDQPYEQEFLITVGGVGIEELQVTSDELRVYPNPTTGELRVTSDKLQVTSVEVFDMMGRKYEISRFARNDAGNSTLGVASTLRLDISNFPAGIYFLRVETDKGIVTKKVVKQ
ncbi:MAG: T9SS type A sorting domain-containing protein [Bacteroidales bacterium]|jgi:Leucine-rich repeat (LRR) protein|nr:T9SS type A sorting domain-containing protein [Bacteroidales bacterium]